MPEVAINYLIDNLHIKVSQEGRATIKVQLLIKDHVISEDKCLFEPREAVFC